MGFEWDAPTRILGVVEAMRGGEDEIGRHQRTGAMATPFQIDAADGGPWPACGIDADPVIGTGNANFRQGWQIVRRGGPCERQ